MGTNKKTLNSNNEDLTVSEVAEKGHYQTFKKRIERYGKAHSCMRSNLDYIIANKPHEKKLINSLSDCGKYLVFRNYFTINEIKLSNGCFCRKHLICPLCAIRRAAKSVGAYMEKYNHVISKNTNLKPYMVTFTVKNGKSLIERFDHLSKSLKLYHKQRHKNHILCEAKKANGAMWSYEMKRGSGSGEWHPHVHAIWLCETPPSQSAISAEWLKITGDSHIVDVRPLRGNDQTELAKSFCEVFKYAVKFAEQEPKDTYDCFLTLSGKRLLGSFGVMYGVKIPETMTDDLYDDLPYIELFMSFTEGKYRLIKSRMNDEYYWKDTEKAA